MAAVQLATPAEGAFLQLSPEKKMRYSNGAWRIHTNNVPVGEQSPAPSIPPTMSETPPSLPHVNPFWQKPSTGEFFYQHNNGSTVVWREVGDEAPPVYPIQSETAPALPNTNPFWIKPSTGEFFVQHDNGTTTVWKEVGDEVAPLFPTLSETAPELPNTNPYWQKTSTGDLYFQKRDGQGNTVWQKVNNDSAVELKPLLSETAPALPNANGFWQKTSTGDLYYQYSDGTNVSWRKVTKFHSYDVTITSGPTVDSDLAQVTVVDNTVSGVKNIAFTNMPSGRAKTMIVIVNGKVGTIGYPANATMADSTAITLSNTKTTLVFFWTGSDFIVSKGPSY